MTVTEYHIEILFSCALRGILPPNCNTFAGRTDAMELMNRGLIRDAGCDHWLLTKKGKHVVANVLGFVEAMTIPELSDAIPLILFFPDLQSANDFSNMVQSTHPQLIPRKL